MRTTLNELRNVIKSVVNNRNVQESVLTKYVRYALVEKMMSIQDASSQGYALTFIGDSSDEQWAVLYSPKEAVSKLKEEGEENATSEKVTEALAHSIVGMIMFAPAATGECYGAYEVMRSAAKPGAGAGPLMYYIAMAVAPSHTLMPDRGSVSDAASKVWQKFDKSVKRLELDDEEDPKTEDPRDDCKLHKDPQRKFLDYAYKAENAGMNLGGLKDKHDEFVADLGFTLENMDDGEIKGAFKEAAKWFFQSAMAD